MLSLQKLALIFFSVVTSAASSTFIPPPRDLTEFQSRNYPDISVSYKETSICETTPGVKAYSGFVTLPSIDKTYNASIFFWYFESREDAENAPTTIYIPGGPGESFLDGGSGFPCTVNADSNSTSLNPWSWNNAVNMLYLDVPVQAGYSFTKAQNGSVDLVNGVFTPAAEDAHGVSTNLSTVVASASSAANQDTLNTTAQVAEQVWQISQVWFQEFPEHKTTSEEINFWSYSYSGFFGPVTAAYFQKQNEKIENGTIEDRHAKKLPVGTLGVNNGCIDSKIQVFGFPEYAYNNTYGIQVISKEVYEEAKHNITMKGGCYDLIDECRALQAKKDPKQYGNNDEVNEACAAATQLCFVYIQGAYTSSSTRSAFDLSLQSDIAFPPDYLTGFFNQRWVQEAVGAPVNFTLAGTTISTNMFALTGDPMVRTVSDVEYLLSSGVNLALVYGDRDYRCNWIGMENVSLVMDYPDAPSFRSSGYADIKTNSSYVGGLVRQHGNVSLSRVFEAGHAVAAYQPETVYQIFKRSIFGRDIATGKVEIDAGSDYSSKGPASSWGTKNKLPGGLDPICYIYEASRSCNDEQLAALEAGTAVVQENIVVSPSSQAGTASNKTTGGGSSSTPSSSTSAGNPLRGPSMGPGLQVFLLLGVGWLLNMI